MPWKLTVRAGAKVQRAAFETLDAALGEVETRARELSAAAPRSAVDVKVRRFEPVQQVAARIELAGPERRFPSFHGGIDVRGDGSIEAYVGRVRRTVVTQRGNETPYAALRRALSGGKSR